MLRTTVFLVVWSAAAAALAVNGPLNWYFQPTDFKADATGNFGAQTALAMRDGRVWPVIFSTGSTGVNAYSLYPVAGANGSHWHQVGTDVLPKSVNGVLSAATSCDGRFAAVVRDNNTPWSSGAVVGSSASGFGSYLYGTTAIDFDSHGNLIQGGPGTIPSSNGLVDISVSATGDVGAIDGSGYYYQRSALLGGWASSTIWSPTYNADLALDSMGRPHVLVPTIGTAGTGPITAIDFEVPVGQWKPQQLTSAYAGLPTVAADSRGGVGAAWVQDNGNSVSLMYAYKDGLSDWSIQPVITNTIPMFGDSLWTSRQKVGLAYDANDFPVISFVAGSSNNIWLAYDPVTVPEPSTLAMLLVGAVVIGFAARKSIFAG